MKVFYSSPWVPVEWIEAHGLQPCGVWFAEDLGCGALPLSAGVCAFSEAMLRFADAHHDSAVIFTTACDQMRRSFDAFAGSQPVRAFLFNLPATWQSPVALRIFRTEVERLGRFLQAHGGRAPTAKDLAQIIERRSQARKQLLESAPRCSARQYAETIARFHWDGSVRVPDHPTPPAPGSIPLAIVGGPLTASQWSLLDLIEAAGARIVLNATESGERSLLPPFRLEGFNDDPIGAVARGYFENCVDVFQRPNTRLYAWLGERLTARGVRGIVLWAHTGCDLWRAEAQTLRETFRLPVLLLEADAVPGGSPRETGRIQAFVETFK
jgi:benzoyl-CoA reductase/2-hydroxyglutaryl-CoA dehydratase subunit BcrC/BadD/HgdB